MTNMYTDMYNLSNGLIINSNTKWSETSLNYTFLNPSTAIPDGYYSIGSLPTAWVANSLETAGLNLLASDYGEITFLRANLEKGYAGVASLKAKQTAV